MEDFTFQNGSDKNMCMKMSELNGLTPDVILNRYWTRNDVPIDIAKILYNMDIKVSAFDFFEVEKDAKISYGDILGAVITKGDKAAIIYKKDESLNRRRFTLAHELAHCCLSHITPTQKGHIEFRLAKKCTEKREMEANVFAGELLIPEMELSGVLKKFYDNTFPSSKGLAQIFSVSIHVMEERLKYLRIPFINSSGLKITYMGWLYLNHNSQDRNDNSSSIDKIQEDLCNIFSEENELDSNAIVTSQITVEPPKTNSIILGSDNTYSDNTYLDEYRKSLLKSTDIADAYHKDAIAQVGKLITNLLNFMWCVGIVSFVLTALCIFLNKNTGAIITPIFGTLLEAIIGYIVNILNTTMRAKEQYFEKGVEMQKYDKVLGLILTIRQEERKTDLIEQVVKDYLNNESEKNKNKPTK